MKGFFLLVFQKLLNPLDYLSSMNYPRKSKIPLRWKIGGGLLIFLFGILTLLAPAFAPEIPLIDRPIITMTVVLLLTGLVFLYLSELTIYTQAGRRLLIWIIAVGALVRVFMFFSTPILEEDYHRYLWDGAVTANGFNPYQFSPEQIREGLSGSAEVPSPLLALARESGSAINSINHDYLRSIYPPLTQGAFALAYLLKPWSLSAWRVVLLLFDVITLLLLFYILRYLNLSPVWIGIYWLNPLLVKEIFNSGHMDILIFPFLLAAILFSIREKPFPAVIALAFAVGVKVWPVVLLPIILRPLYPHYKRLLLAGGLFGILCLLLFLPVYLAGLDTNSGFNAYSQRWELNDSLFKIYLWISLAISKIIGIHPGHSQLLARVLAVFTLLGWTAYITLQKSEKPRDIFDQVLLIVAGMFLLLPNQFPWYGVWLIPFLAISPRKPLLWLTLLLPLYYLRYYFQGRGQAALFDNWIVWLEFIPLWILILREWRIARRLKLYGSSIQGDLKRMAE